MSGSLQMRAAGPRMFGCPQWNPEREYDVVFVGVPTDVGGLGHRSPSAAPHYLRSTSGVLPYRNGEGWFDLGTDNWLLQGVSMADAGDVVCDRTDGIRALEGLSGGIQTLRDSCKLLVVLGGDHSVSYFTARTLSGETIVWIDAHDDATPKGGDYPDCSNVVTYIADLDEVESIVQWGLRGINTVPNARHKREVVVGAPEGVGAKLAKSEVERAMVSIDVDVIDPCYLPAVGSAMPGGAHPDDVVRVFESLADAGVGVSILELMEFAPNSDADTTQSLLLLNMLLKSIAQCARTFEGVPK